MAIAKLSHNHRYKSFAKEGKFLMLSLLWQPTCQHASGARLFWEEQLVFLTLFFFFWSLNTKAALSTSPKGTSYHPPNSHRVAQLMYKSPETVGSVFPRVLLAPSVNCTSWCLWWGSAEILTGDLAPQRAWIAYWHLPVFGVGPLCHNPNADVQEGYPHGEADQIPAYYKSGLFNTITSSSCRCQQEMWDDTAIPPSWLQTGQTKRVSILPPASPACRRK